MDKKTYVLKVLNVISSDWPVAEGLIYLIEKNAFDDKVLDILVKLVRDALENTSNEIRKMTLTKAEDVLSKIKASEAEEQKLDEKDIEDLEKMIDSF